MQHYYCFLYLISGWKHLILASTGNVNEWTLDPYTEKPKMNPSYNGDEIKKLNRHCIAREGKKSLNFSLNTVTFI